MKRLAARLAAILALSAPELALPCVAEPVPGLALLADDPAQHRPLSLSIWHPATAGVAMQMGGNAVFAGIPAQRDASVAGGPFPLVLLSHGGLRSAADSGAWLGALLAAQGFLAVEINAPPPETAQAAVDEIWRRPRDISRALDLMLADPHWAAYVDPARISVVGFALGGTAALTLAGADFDAVRYGRACAGPKPAGPDCAWLAAQDVSLNTVDPAGLARMRRDRRVASAIAIAPEYLSAFQGKGDADGAPVLILSLGQEAAPNGPHGPRAVIPDAQPFDAFALCTDAAPQILLAEGEDPALCGTGKAARARIHQQITEVIGGFLRGGQAAADAGYGCAPDGPIDPHLQDALPESVSAEPEPPKAPARFRPDAAG